MKKILRKKRGKWNFGGKVPKNFQDHVSRSVPLYYAGHDLILKLSDFFLKENSICYDLGCSTGDLIIKLHNYVNKNIKIIGIDSEKEMVSFCKQKLKKEKIKNASILHKNIQKYNLKKSDMIISYYTIQFIPPKARQIIINKIYKSLNWGGAFIFFEKIRGADARFQDILNSTYYDFKEEQGFSLEELNNKNKSLRGVMEPFSEKGNLGLLKRAGFEDVMPICQYINFKGFLCIK